MRQVVARDERALYYSGEALRWGRYRLSVSLRYISTCARPLQSRGVRNLAQGFDILGRNGGFGVGDMPTSGLAQGLEGGIEDICGQIVPLPGIELAGGSRRLRARLDRNHWTYGIKASCQVRRLL